MKICITGATGFIGSHLRWQLEHDEHKVTNWDRKSNKDIKDFELNGEDFVIHLAALADVRASLLNPDLYWKNNVEYTTRIQRICNEAKVPLLYASSSCIHAWHKSPYGISKKVNEETAFPGQVGLRFTTVYGDGARDTMFMGRLKDRKLNYATDHIRDFIHVDDVLDAIDLIMLKITDPHLFNGVKLEKAYDIGTGVGHKVSDLARILMPDIEIKSGDDCEALDNTADISKIQELGFAPTINARDFVENLK